MEENVNSNIFAYQIFPKKTVKSTIFSNFYQINFQSINLLSVRVERKPPKQ